jgi:hypothetical protein
VRHSAPRRRQQEAHQGVDLGVGHPLAEVGGHHARLAGREDLRLEGIRRVALEAVIEVGPDWAAGARSGQRWQLPQPIRLKTARPDEARSLTGSISVASLSDSSITVAEELS